MRFPRYLVNSLSLEEVKVFLQTLAPFMNDCPQHLPAKVLHQAFNHFVQFDANTFTVAEEVLLESVLIMIVDSCNQHFYKFFPTSFSMNHIPFLGKFPTIDTQIARIGVRLTHILPQDYVLWNNLMTFMTIFVKVNVSEDLYDLFLLLACLLACLLAYHCPNLFVLDNVIEVFLRLWRFHECHRVLIKILHTVQDGESMFSRLVDENVVGMLRDAFQDSHSIPSALKAINHLLFLDRNHVFILFLDCINSSH
jgi:hypothetical protein